MHAEIKKPLKIDDEQIEEILDIRYGDSRVIPLFNELEHVASRPNDQVDHIWARAILSSKKAIKKLYPSITDDEIEKYKSQLNRLANLQLLDIVVNNEKSDTPFDEWMYATYPDSLALSTYRQTHFIPVEETYDFALFMKFIENRETLLKQKIREAFPSDFEQLVARYVLQDKLS